MPYVEPTSVRPLVIYHQRLNRLSEFHENVYKCSYKKKAE